jgi:predicted Zn-dependent protease
LAACPFPPSSRSFRWVRSRATESTPPRKRSGRASGCQVEQAQAIPVPGGAYRADRKQHDADLLLEALFDRLALDVCRIIGLCEVDLFADGRNYVFGYAHMRDRVAVVSTFRLASVRHLEKAVVHELGHTFHAPHCASDGRCVMRQVEHLWQLDLLDVSYCPACDERIASVAALGVDHAEALFELAGSYMRRRRHGRAVAAYSAACQRAPDNAHYANDLGVALLALGERALAMRAFQRAIELAPAFPHPYYNLGIAFRERGDVAAADDLFASALERDADLRAAHRYLGILHQDYFQDPPRARAHLERYVALGGTDTEVAERLRLLSRRGMQVLASSSRRMLESTQPL